MDRNFLLFMVIAFSIFIGWQVFYINPQVKKSEALQALQALQKNNSETSVNKQNNNSVSDLSQISKPLSTQTKVKAVISIKDAIQSRNRVRIDTPSISGSLNLEGLRIDDITLKNYYTDTTNNTNIRLLNPKGTNHSHYIQLGFITKKGIDENILWKQIGRGTLTPTSPIHLRHEEDSLIYDLFLTIDDVFMFNIDFTVTNKTTSTLTIRPFAVVVQRNLPEEYQNFAILHEGLVGVANKALIDKSYKKLIKSTELAQFPSQGGWIGITNKYWLAAVIPSIEENVTFGFRNIGDKSLPIFRSSYTGDALTIKANDKMKYSLRAYAGSKNVEILKHYQNGTKVNNNKQVTNQVTATSQPIPNFDKAVDWGRLFFLTRPIFNILNFFFKLTGQFWLAIILLTLVIKAALYPLASKGYESMSRMKKIQPQLMILKEAHKNDATKMQQETMALYKRENVSPLMGCLPILIQMPIFFSLYKTLFVTIEMRHQSFLWISDLSAKDPSNIFNLFSLLPFDPTAIPLIGSFLSIGILPLLMGVGMWVQTSLNPPPTDPTQKKIFALMPIFFTFIFAPFAAGLVLYWFWNTVLSVIQQALILRKNGVEIEIIKNITNLLHKKSALNNSNKNEKK